MFVVNFSYIHYSSIVLYEKIYTYSACGDVHCLDN